jgi:hypothetical protein
MLVLVVRLDDGDEVRLPLPVWHPTAAKERITAATDGLHIPHTAPTTSKIPTVTRPCHEPSLPT